MEKSSSAGQKTPDVRPSRRRFHGFTLVELIVVITILAILATIGFLALSGYSQDAKDSAVKANVRSLQTAIASEAAMANNSPRYYVVHDSDYALSGAFAYVDGVSVALTGWDVGSAPADSNYTAGKPDYKKLKLNPDKFRVSSSGLPGGTLGVLARASGFGAAGFGASGFGADSAEASYDPSSLMAAGADFTVAGANGRKRIVSYVQSAGISPATKLASVMGNFPTTGTPAGHVSGLLRSDPGSASNLTGALLDGGTGNGDSTPPPGSCTLPWGWTVASGSTTPAFSATTVNEPSACSSVAVSVLCSNGTLSHPSAVQSCSPKDPNYASSKFVLSFENGISDAKGLSVSTNAWAAPHSGNAKFGNGSFNTASNYVLGWSGSIGFGAANFTAEAWIYPTAAGTASKFFLISQNANGIVFWYRSATEWWLAANGQPWIATTTIMPALNQWSHVAVTRSGTSVYLFLNGTLVWSNTSSFNFPQGPVYLGHPDSANYGFQGLMDDVRITVGTARYTSNFAPPKNYPNPEF